MPGGDQRNLQLGGEGVIHHKAQGRVMDHAFACLVGDFVNLQQVWVLAIVPHSTVAVVETGEQFDIVVDKVETIM